MRKGPSSAENEAGKPGHNHVTRTVAVLLFILCFQFLQIRQQIFATSNVLCELLMSDCRVLSRSLQFVCSSNELLLHRG